MKTTFIVLVIVSLAALPACEQKTEESTLTGDSAAATNPDSAAMRAPTGPVVTELNAVNNSGIEGEATATHSANEVTVSILLQDGAKADVSYPAHIHTGSCDQGGPIAIELTPVKNLQSSKTIPVSALPAHQNAFVQVHDASGKPVACGDMKGHGDSGYDNTRDSIRATPPVQ